MRVLVVHYHLRPGGVTTVVRRQLSALAELGIEAAALVGEAGPGCGACVAVEPALAYDEPACGLADPAKSAAIARAARREADALGPDTVIHVHNPTIRKNASLLPALRALAAEGRPLVMHVHDLAEDWRPDAYSPEAYPDGAHWAVINRRDEAALKGAGAEAVTFLPNPVPCPPWQAEASFASGPGLVLYPVRGIRRKNLGEAVLLSLFARQGSRVGVTLPPTSPRDLPYYESWIQCAARYRAPVSFGLGLAREFDALYAEARAALTTSVKEGFGLSFLEPAARGRVTLGRRLTAIVADFEAEGLAFSGLYDELLVPPGLFEGEAFRARVEETIERALQSYGRLPGGLGAAEYAGLVMDSLSVAADFGRLDEAAQREVLSAVATPGADRARASLAALNPWLPGWDEAADELGPLDLESLAPWSEARYGERLESLYRATLSGSSGRAPRKGDLLDAYLTPEAYHGVGV